MMRTTILNIQNPKISCVALFANFNVPEKANAALQVADYLSDIGVVVAFHAYNRDKIFRMRRHKSSFLYLNTDELYTTTEMVIVFGGDGTILEAARFAAPHNIPLLNFNLGRVGYMAELELSEMEMLKDICDGNYFLDERSMLSVQVYNSSGKLRKSTFALNDAVITNGALARLVDLELYESDRLLTTYRADGLIVSTPTGSTAYFMSAGGSIVDPHLAAICVAPICSYSLMARPILFTDSSEICIKNVCLREKMIYLTVDGKINIELYVDNMVKIRKSELKTLFVRVKDRSFYTNLSAKLCNTAKL